MRALVAGGADIIELGVPFSDPMADGPTIQRASERALAHGMSLRRVLALVSEFRKENATTPVVLMGYANPVEAYGVDAFARDAPMRRRRWRAGGRLSARGVRRLCRRDETGGIDPIFLLAPTSTEKRYDEVAQIGSGYIYYVSLKGVTGSGALDLDEVARAYR
jgi:tryptophan synthase alpha chain